MSVAIDPSRLSEISEAKGDVRPRRALLLSGAILLLVWGVIIGVVDPRGEFMVNDDWAYVRMLETLKEGRIIETGWGPGGPSAIVHVLWGALFSSVTGFSMTTLRLSVLVLAVVGSVGLLILLWSAGAPTWLALFATFAVILNPLFMAESFSFMTDITFVSLAILAMICLYFGVERLRTSLVFAGMGFALGSILTRQIGIVLPAGFLAACWIHPLGARLGRMKMLLIVACIVLIPWVAYELFLYKVGSTPVTYHYGFTNIFAKPLEKGFPDYLIYLFSNLVLWGLTYSGFFLSPLLLLRFRSCMERKDFRSCFVVFTVLFLIFEAAVIVGQIDPPILLHRNVIFNLGIGPVALKDTYILGIQRTVSMPKFLYCLVVYCSALSALMLLGFIYESFISLWRKNGGIGSDSVSFLAYFALFASLFYLGIITVTGFHDRYHIPLTVFLVVWFTSAHLRKGSLRLVSGWTCIAATLLSLMAVFSVAGVRDFMELKRRLATAHEYVLQGLQTSPCNFDGGFEFNGYHCYRKDFVPPEGLSWWWVTREDYLTTLGPLQGYRVVREFPFKRFLGQDGVVCVLERNTPAAP